MSFGTQQGSTTATTTTEPWSAQRGPLKAGYNEAVAFRQQPLNTFFPGSTVPQFSLQSLLSQAGTTGRALSGSPVTGAAQNQAQQTLQGDFLDPSSNPFLSGLQRTASGANLTNNPNLDAVIKAMQGGVQSQVSSLFERGGRYGSGSFASMSAQERAKLEAQVRYQDYANERQLQQGAQQTGGQLTSQERQRQLASIMPGLAAAGVDYTDLAQLLGVGQQIEAKEGEQLSEDAARHYYDQDAQLQRLQDYMQLISGGQFRTTTSTSPFFSNPFGSMIGGGLSGAAAGAGIGSAALAAGSPWMWPLIGGGAALGAFT